MQEAGGPIPCMLCAPARRVVDAGEGCLVQSSLQRKREGRKDESQSQNHSHEPRCSLDQYQEEGEEQPCRCRGGKGPTYGDMITCAV